MARKRILGSAASGKLVRSACTVVKHNAHHYDSNKEKKMDYGKENSVSISFLVNIFRNIFSVFSYVWCYKNILVSGESFPGKLNIATKMAKDDLCLLGNDLRFNKT